MLWLLLLVWAAAATATERPGEVLLRALSRPFAPVAPDAEISAQCREHSLLYLRELEDLAPWAIHMYDASTKIPPGVVTGNIQQLGNYDQCLAISVHRERHSFRGQLCTATVQFAVGGFSNDSQLNNATGAEAEGAPGLREIIMAVDRAADLQNWTGPLSKKYEWAFCVPSSCSASDVEATLNHALLPLNTSGVAEVMVSAEPERCLTAGSGPQLKARDYSFIVMVALFGGLVVLSTIYDLAGHRSPWCSKDINRRSRTQLVLAAFSLYSNARHVFSTHQKADTMACLNGMRFLSMVWIIFGHTYYQKAVSPQINSITITHFSSDWSKMLIMNGTVSADTFFMLSGLLLAFNFLRERQRHPSFNFNLAAFYLHRYFRITPVYAVVVFFYATLFQFVGSGPLWGKWVLTNRDNCLANWWTNLLYVNNFVNVPQMCLSQSWYLAVDMQLMWLSPIVLVPLWKWRRVGRCVLGAALWAAIVSPFVITVVHHLAGVMIYTSDSIVGVFLDVYLPVYTRGGPFIIGIALGSALFATKGRELHFSKVHVAVCWLLAALFGVVGVFGAFGIYQPDHVYNVWEAGVYAALHRTLWAVGLAWVVIACENGYGGPVDALLSWPCFQPLSRLTYGAYLAHFSVMLYNSGTMRTPGYLSDYSVIHDFLGNLMLTLAIAVVLALVFEIPFVNLVHALFPVAVSGGTNNGSNGTNGNNVMAEYHSPAGEEAAAAPVDQEAGTAQGGYDNGAFEQPTPSSQHRSPV